MPLMPPALTGGMLRGSHSEEKGGAALESGYPLCPLSRGVGGRGVCPFGASRAHPCPREDMLGEGKRPGGPAGLPGWTQRTGRTRRGP